MRANRFGCDLLIPIPCLPDTLLEALVQVVADGVTHRESDVLDSWLFVRNEESVRIVRRSDCELSVSGPKWERAVHQFRSELELSSYQADYEQRLASYQADYEQRLVNEGFSFEGFRKDRRRPNRSLARPRPSVTFRPLRIARRSATPGHNQSSLQR
jgi:hypothetical protein